MRRRLLLALPLAACVAPPPADEVTIAPGVVLTLPPPESLGRSVEAVQRIAARYSGEVYAFESRISITPARLRLAGTDPMGRRAMTVTWAETGLQVETASFVPDGLRPANILADVMLLHWPAAVLRARLHPPETSLEDDGEQRRVLSGGRELIVVTRPPGGGWTGRWRLENRAWGYTIDVQSAEIAA